MNLQSIIVGAIEVIAGAFLLATGIGSGLGAKLLLAGTLTLISAFMGARTGRGGFSTSPTYGWDNLGNAAYEGSPVPVIYGEHLVRPGIVSTNLRVEAGVQVLYLLCLIGAGEIHSISQVRLNDVPIESFAGASADTTTALGTQSQGVIPGFNETGRQYPAGTHLDLAESHVHEMRGEADAVAINLVWQGGLQHYSTKGDLADTNSIVEVYAKAYGAPDSAYQPISPSTLDKPWERKNNKAGTWSVWGRSTTAVRKQILLRLDGKKDGSETHLARGRYVIKVVGGIAQKSGDSHIPDVASIVELSNDNRTYAGFAMMGLRLPASAQLNGIPKIECVVKGRKVYDPRDASTAWSDNPVLCVRDLLTNTWYGLGVAESKLDATSWEAAADACDATITPAAGGSAEAKWRLDYVLDVQSPGVDHLQQMLAGCRMTLSDLNRKVYVVHDTTGASARTFEGRTASIASGRANIRDEGDAGDRRSTLRASSLELSQRWSRVRVQYIDRNRAWQQRVVEVFDTYINIGAVTVASFGVGNKIKGQTSGAIGRLTHGYANGAAFLTYTQDDGATAFQSGEVIKDLTTGATATASSAPYTLSTDRPLEIQLYGVTRRTQALREGRKALNDARSRTVFSTWGGFLGDLDLLPGGVVAVAADHLPWTGKLFTLLSVGFDADGLAVFNAREYDADVYSDNVDTSQVDSLQFQPGGSVPPGLRDPATPSDGGSTANAPATGLTNLGTATPPPSSSASSGKVSFFGSFFGSKR